MGEWETGEGCDVRQRRSGAAKLSLAIVAAALAAFRGGLF